MSTARMRSLFTVAWLAASTLGTANAQTLLALENGSLAATGPLVQEISPECRRVQDCIARVLGPSIAAPLGGIARDARDGSLWVTNGTELVHIDAACEVIDRCQIPTTVGSGWTGLAFDARDHSLLFTTSSNAIGRIPASCPISHVDRLCSFPSGTLNGTLTGIEVDLFTNSYWVCDDTGLVLNFHAAPSTLLCRVSVRFQGACPNSPLPTPVSGITLDRCAGVIYLAHGRYGIARFDLLGTPMGCCSLATPSFSSQFVGLAWKSAPPRVLGRGCSDPVCAACVPELGVAGDTVTPNANFALILRNAQPGTRFFLLFNIAGGPIVIPGLCGPLQVAVLPPPLSVGLFPVGSVASGTPPCDGAARVQLGIPLDPALCGGDVFTQALGLCASPVGLGLYLSNGLWITVQ